MTDEHGMERKNVVGGLKGFGQMKAFESKHEIYGGGENGEGGHWGVL